MVYIHIFSSCNAHDVSRIDLGHIAKLAGMPNHSRHVGQGEYYLRLILPVHAQPSHPSPALKFLPPNTNPPIPWHRVIGASGAISSRGPGTDGAQQQRDALIAEGVEVTTGRTGELRVDIHQFGWFPSAAQIRDQWQPHTTDEQLEGAAGSESE